MSLTGLVQLLYIVALVLFVYGLIGLKTAMLFGDAKASVSNITAELTAL